MSRRLLLGRAGAGKTHACLERFAAVLEAGGRALFLVPTHSQAEHLRSLLLARHQSLARRPVATFTRLAESVTGRRLRDLAGRAVQDRLAQEVLLATFPEAAAQPGFRGEFLTSVKELKEQGLSPDAARLHAEEHFLDESRGRRLFLAFAAYTERLGTESRFDHEDLLLSAREQLAAAPPAYDLVAIDGFHDFTVVQKSIIDLLAGHAGETMVTMPLDADDRSHPVFASAARTAARFSGFSAEKLRGNRRGFAGLEARLFAPAHSVPAASPVSGLPASGSPGADPPDGSGGPRVVHRQLSLFTSPSQPSRLRRYGGQAVPDEPASSQDQGASSLVQVPGLEVVAWPGAETEADRTARFVSASGRRYKDFLVVRRSFAGMHAIYRAAFERHGVPLRFFGSEPLGRIPAARAAVLWLRHLATPLEPSELVPLLRSPYLRDRPDPGYVDRIAAQLREGPKDAKPANGDADAFVAAVARPETGRLPDLLARRLGVQDALLDEPDGSEDIARAARFFRVLLREAEAVADWPLGEAAEHVAARVPHLQDSFRDRRHDCVYAVDASEARQWEKPVVIVTGLTADAFPRQVRQDLFLRDDERRDLAEQRGLSLPLRARREDEERYLFYVALTRARERLVLSWPAYDEDGADVPMSPYLEETLAALDVNVRRVSLSEQHLQPEDAVTRRDLLPIVADGLAQAQPQRVALAASLHDRGAVARALLALPRRLELARARPIALPSDPAATLSASRINRFLRCPYLFLMSGVLHVNRERKAGLDPLLRGTIVHDALERVANEPDADPGALFDEVFLAGTDGLRLSLREVGDRRWMRLAVLRAAEDLRTQPVEAAEHEFEIDVDDVRLRGKIDRLDRYPAGVLVRDYKTGIVDQKRIDAFEDLQLDIYLLAMDEPAGAVYERLRRDDAVGYVLPELADAGIGGKAKTVTREELEQRREHTRNIVRATAGDARAGRLAVHPRDPDTCTRARCDGFDLCRVAHGRWLERVARAEAGSSRPDRNTTGGKADGRR